MEELWDHCNFSETKPFRDTIKLKERFVEHIKIAYARELEDYYNFGVILGQGKYGIVYAVSDKTTSVVYAMKMINKEKANLRIIHNEINILKMIDHPNLIRLHRIFESGTKMYLVFEKCHGELAEIFKEKRVFTENETRIVIKYLANAMDYLHKHNIIHRDLKLENILTTMNPNDPTDYLFIKITDFGFSVEKSCNRIENMATQVCGTLTYMAPEVIGRGTYSHRCDVWAMGVITYLMLTGKYPFYASNESMLVNRITNEEPSFSGFIGSPEAVHLITKMLAKNPAQRLTAGEVKCHAWVRGETMTHDSTENVLDMMRLWRPEMLKPVRDQTDWASAFKIVHQQQQQLQQQLQQQQQEAEDSDEPVITTLESGHTSVDSASNKERSSANIKPKPSGSTSTAKKGERTRSARTRTVRSTSPHSAYLAVAQLLKAFSRNECYVGKGKSAPSNTNTVGRAGPSRPRTGPAPMPSTSRQATPLVRTRAAAEPSTPTAGTPRRERVPSTPATPNNTPRRPWQ